MRKEGVWALAPDRIIGFFRSQAEIAPVENGFQFRNCRISVTPLAPRLVAGMELPQTQVTFEGSEESVSLIYEQFIMRFLSAGG